MKMPNAAIKYGIIFIFAIGAISGSLRLMISDSGLATSGMVFSLSFFGLLIVFFSDRVISLDVRNLKVELQSVKESKAAIEEVSLNLVKLILLSNKYSVIHGGPEDFEDKLIQNSKKVLAASGIKNIDEIIKKYH